MNLLISILKNRLDRWLKHDDKQPWTDYYGSIPKHLDYPSYSMYELIEETVNKYPKYISLDYFGKKINYSNFYKKIEECARALKQLGVKENDKITVCMPNTPEGVITFYAINMVGAIAVMIHPLSSEKEIEFYINKSNSKYVIAIDLTYNRITEAVKNTKIEKIIICSISRSMKKFTRFLYWITSGRKNKIVLNKNTMKWNLFIKEGKSYQGIYKISRSAYDEAVILFSGGTTGNPKGIVLSNLNFNSLAMQSHLMCDPSKAGDSVLSIMPIFHGFGIGVSIHTPLHAGMKCILVPQFKAKEFAKIIRKYQPNFLAGVPTMYEALVNSKTRNPLYMTSVSTVVCGGDILNPVLRKRVNNYLAKHGSKANIRVGYGLTECTGASCLTPKFYYKEGSIGVPFPDMLYKIVKIGGIDTVKPNKDGEICISGPSVMIKYLDEKEETKNVLKYHSDGKLWLHTGDIGYMNKNGMVFFKTRLKRLIVSSGYNVYPPYIEKILNSHPAIEISYVVGIPHPYKEEVPKAYIVLKEGFKLDDKLKEEIKSYCEKNIAKYSLPHEYEYRDSLPKTLVGKVTFSKLKE